MLIRCYNEEHPYLLFIDVEFDSNMLVQFAGLLFKWVDKETYQLMKSYNAYVSRSVCYPFMEYTSITNNFLQENGVPLKDLISYLYDDFLFNIPLDQLEIISHGLKNDRIVLLKNGLNLSYYTKLNKQYQIDGYCTFVNAKRILQRQEHLKLADLCEECGYYLHNAHNAFNDVWGEVAVYTYLRKKEVENLQGE